MKANNKTPEPISDKPTMQVDTSEFQQLHNQLATINETLNTLKVDVERNIANVNNRIDANREYTDTEVSVLKRKMDTANEEILKRIDRGIANAVNTAMLPFVGELATVDGRSRQNKEGAEMIKSDITELKTEGKNTFTEIRNNHTENQNKMDRLIFGVFGDGKTSDGIIGKVGELEATTKKLDRVYEFVAGINWRFVAVSVGGISSAPVITAILKLFNII